ncbi:hypothetical protein IMCC3317_21210 [Kordia antarctica]|uniref:Uncharacterized protein n=1 Tax=Kordia antarctica TaxID=1218801 RepID=A0A7L4ZJR3_9FLAO|nr:hypothetical protein [Kordia antarctica]QHI36751.1 hypothetical protein IMCC3317_21210 [Kordia antarctica]
MRFLKILLILFSLLILIGICYLYRGIFSKDELSRIPTSALLFSGLLTVLSIVNILYHIKSFRFYRRKEKQNLDKKLSKIFWIGTLCFSSFLLFLMGTALYENTQRFEYDSDVFEDIIYTFIFIALALLGLLEVSLLKKHIKRLKAEVELKDEIESIGN